MKGCQCTNSGAFLLRITQKNVFFFFNNRHSELSQWGSKDIIMITVKQLVLKIGPT